MAALPYMQLYIADYLADTAHLNAIQHGAYLLLLMNYWQRGKPLADDNGRLTNVARMSNEEWNENRTVLAEFFEVRDGFWIHKRVERDLAAVKGKSEQASAAGRASAQRRSNGRSTGVATGAKRTFNHTDTDTEKETDTENTARAREDPEDVSVAGRVLSEKVGIHNLHGQAEMCSLLRHSRKEGETVAQCVDRACRQWERYNEVRAKLNYPVTSAQKFFNSGTWQDEKRWPWKDMAAVEPKRKYLTQ